MLPRAAPAHAEVGAPGLDPVGRGFDDASTVLARTNRPRSSITSASTVSPGTAPRTNAVRPSSRCAMASPPYARLSMSSVIKDALLTVGARGGSSYREFESLRCGLVGGATSRYSTGGASGARCHASAESVSSQRGGSSRWQPRQYWSCTTTPTSSSALRAALAAQSPDIELVNALSGPRALGMMAQAVPAVLVVDAELAGVDGYAFTRQVKTAPATAQVPIIIVSLDPNEVSALKARQVGAAAHLPSTGPVGPARGQDRRAGVAQRNPPRNPRRSRHRPRRPRTHRDARFAGRRRRCAGVSLRSEQPGSRRGSGEAPATAPPARTRRRRATRPSRRRRCPRSLLRSRRSLLRAALPAATCPHIDDMLRLMLERGGSDLHHRRGQRSRYPPARRAAAGRGHAAALSARHDGDDPRAALRGAAPPLRDRARARLRLQHPGSLTLPRQRLPAAQLDGCGLPRHPHQDPDARGSRPAQGVHVPRRAPPRARAGDRPHGLGQVDHPRGHGRPHQRDARSCTS